MPHLVTAPVLPIPVISELVVANDAITLRLYEELDGEGRGRHTHRTAERSDAPPATGRHETGHGPYPYRHYPRSFFDGARLDSALDGRPLVPLWGCVFDLATMRQRRDWTDMGVWAFLYAYHTRQYSGPTNLTPLTLAKRQDLLTYADENGLLFLGTVLVPTRGASFDQLRIRVNHHPDYPLIGADAEALPAASALDSIAPRLTIAGPETVPAGEAAVFTIAADSGVPLDSELHLETTAGYLAERRVRLDRSPVFSVRALDLPPGAEIRLKAGFRHWPGLAEKIVRVT